MIKYIQQQAKEFNWKLIVLFTLSTTLIGIILYQIYKYRDNEKI